MTVCAKRLHRRPCRPGSTRRLVTALRLPSPRLLPGHRQAYLAVVVDDEVTGRLVLGDVGNRVILKRSATGDPRCAGGSLRMVDAARSCRAYQMLTYART